VSRDLKREREIARAEQAAEGGLQKWKPQHVRVRTRRAEAPDAGRWLRLAERESQEMAEKDVEAGVSGCFLDEFSR
jgi:hypothetical protein